MANEHSCNSRRLALAPGTRIGPYEVTIQIGVGGMGEVYHASDTGAVGRALPGSPGAPDKVRPTTSSAQTTATPAMMTRVWM